MSPSQAAICCLLIVSSVLASGEAPAGERAAFVASASMLILALLEEVGRHVTRSRRGAGPVLEVVAVLAFLTHFGFVAYRFVALR